MLYFTSTVKFSAFSSTNFRIVETGGVVQLGKKKNQKPEKLYNDESGNGEEEDILQESSCI